MVHSAENSNGVRNGPFDDTDSLVRKAHRLCASGWTVPLCSAHQVSRYGQGKQKRSVWYLPRRRRWRNRWSVLLQVASAKLFYTVRPASWPQTEIGGRPRNISRYCSKILIFAASLAWPAASGCCGFLT